MRETVLIVDDCDLLRFAVRDLLAQEFPDCDFTDAGSAEDGLAIACRDRPRVVIMDINLPGMNGIAATRAIREMLPATHVVMFTLSEMEEDRSAAAAAGASDYVLKSDDNDALQKVLRRLLRHGETPRIAEKSISRSTCLDLQPKASRSGAGDYPNSSLRGNHCVILSLLV